MVPLIGTVKELAFTKTEMLEELALVNKEQGTDFICPIGTMIEIPRAAITADKVATEAEFFSFGTNDLTQMGFGYSRDDSGSFLPEYVAKKILEDDPFQSLDQEGIGELVQDRLRKGPRHPPRHPAGRLRRARRRPPLGQVLPPRGPGLRQLQPLPCAHRHPRGRPGGAGAVAIRISYSVKAAPRAAFLSDIPWPNAPATSPRSSIP